MLAKSFELVCKQFSPEFIWNNVQKISHPWATPELPGSPCDRVVVERLLSFHSGVRRVTFVPLTQDVSSEIALKRVELLKAVAPRLTHLLWPLASYELDHFLPLLSHNKLEYLSVRFISSSVTLNLICDVLKKTCPKLRVLLVSTYNRESLVQLLAPLLSATTELERLFVQVADGGPCSEEWHDLLAQIVKTNSKFRYLIFRAADQVLASGIFPTDFLRRGDWDALQKHLSENYGLCLSQIRSESSGLVGRITSTFRSSYDPPSLNSALYDKIWTPDSMERDPEGAMIELQLMLAIQSQFLPDDILWAVEQLDEILSIIHLAKVPVFQEQHRWRTHTARVVEYLVSPSASLLATQSPENPPLVLRPLLALLKKWTAFDPPLLEQIGKPVVHLVAGGVRDTAQTKGTWIRSAVVAFKE